MLYQIYIPVIENNFYQYLAAIILLAAGLSLIVSFALSLLIISLYKRAVIKGMGLALKTEKSDKKVELNQINEHLINEPMFVLKDDKNEPIPKTLKYKMLEKILNRNLLIHAISNLFFGLAWAVISLRGFNLDYSYFFVGSMLHLFVMPVLFYLVIYCWPFVFSVSSIWARGRKQKVLTFGSYFTWYIVSTVLFYYSQDEFDDFKLFQLFLPFLVYNLWPSFIILLLKFSKIQTISLTIFLFNFILSFVSLLIIAYLDHYKEFISNYEQLPALNFIVANYFIAVLVTVLFSLLIAALMILALKKLYIVKYINEQQISIDAQLLIFSSSYFMWEIFKSPSFTTIILCLLPFVIYKTINTLLYVIFKTRHQNKIPIKLLLLRVFALQDASRKLFQRIQVHWQFAGPVLMISGPDLATTTIDSTEMIDFVTSNLKNRFCHDHESIERNLNGADIEPDNDGSFRVTEFFCRDTIWKEVLVRLVCISNVALLDLRSFSEIYKGCQYEIQQVVNHIDILKVIVLIDEHTNIDFLKTTFINAFKNQQLSSPKLKSERPQVQLYYFKGNNPNSFSDLLKLLCSVSANLN